jgi:hypothetical protein
VRRKLKKNVIVMPLLSMPGNCEIMIISRSSTKLKGMHKPK